MSRQLKKKKKQIRRKKREEAFVATIQEIIHDSLLTPEEIQAMAKTPVEGEVSDETRVTIDPFKIDYDLVTVVEGLQGHVLFSKPRLKRHKNTLALMQHEFHPKYFREEEGASLYDLRTEKSGKYWGSDWHVTMFCLMLIGCELALWTYPRHEWSALKHGLPKIRFVLPNEMENEDGREHISEEDSDSKPSGGHSDGISEGINSRDPDSGADSSISA